MTTLLIVLPNFPNSVRAYLLIHQIREALSSLDTGIPGRMILPTSARGEIYLAAANLSILPVQTALVNQVLLSVSVSFQQTITTFR